MLLTEVIYALGLNVGTDEYDMTSRTYSRKRREGKGRMKRLRELYYKFYETFVQGDAHIGSPILLMHVPC